MLDKKNFYIDGKWVSPIEPRNYTVIDPSNEDPCAEISLGGKKDIDKAVSAAKKAFETWAFTTKDERLELLEKLYTIYKKRWAEMAKLISLEMGAPIKFSTEMQAAAGASHIKSFKKILKDRGIRYALLTGTTIAAYSVWDKVGVQYVNPLLYMYMLALGTAVGLLPYIFWKYAAGSIKKELVFNKTPIIAAGILVFVAYGSVLSAMQLSNVSYVSPAREIGIVFSVILGSVVLKERMNIGRLVGSVAIASGVFLIAIG